MSGVSTYFPWWFFTLILCVICLVIALASITSGNREGDIVFLIFMILSVIFLFISAISYGSGNPRSSIHRANPRTATD